MHADCDDTCHGGEPYTCIVADPPWKLSDKLPGKKRGAARNYRCLTVSEIMRFPLPAIADDAILFLWRLSSMPQEALDVVKAWGFVPKSEIVWEKLTKAGNPWFGMGRYVRAAHETCIVATRGRFKVSSKSVRSRFAAMVPVGPGGKHIHSAKPEEFFALVDQLATGQKIEMFARRRRPGWCARGDELCRQVDGVRSALGVDVNSSRPLSCYAEDAVKRIAELEAELAEATKRAEATAFPLRTLAEVAKLKDGWDSYGGKAPYAQAIEAATHLLTRIQPVPTSDGGLQLDYGEFSIIITPEGFIRHEETEGSAT